MFARMTGPFSVAPTAAQEAADGDAGLWQATSS